MPAYYTNARTEVTPYLPPHPKRLLELGCAAGGTIAYIKTMHPNIWAAGVELHGESAETAQAHADVVWQGTVEDVPWDRSIPAASLDVVLSLDVLEHLVDPWAAVKRLTPLLAPGGKLIISIPNVRNWKFICKLFFNGDFRYRDAGLLDRTHLRFFTRATPSIWPAVAALRSKTPRMRITGTFPIAASSSQSLPPGISMKSSPSNGLLWRTTTRI